jgi:hypothetical protein
VWLLRPVHGMHLRFVLVPVVKHVPEAVVNGIEEVRDALHGLMEGADVYARQRVQRF